MAKAKTQYSCTECGASSPKWQGQCPGCGQWNTLVEAVIETAPPAGRDFAALGGASRLQLLAEIRPREEPRQPTGVEEFDRVLGGGLVAGGVVLIGGDPGIGKSTLLLQALARLAQTNQNVLYVSGEESGEQVALRARRLQLDVGGMQLLAEINLEKILATLVNLRPAVAVIDSIQTMWSDALQSAPGSVAQVRECAAYLVQLAKATGIPIFIVGHVTKEGNIAGPRIVEHVVDTVLYFEGEQHKQYRILRVTKNRFGSTNEVGIFEMKENGLVEVADPSRIFLLERPKDSLGSVVTAAIEGTRPMLIEIEALVAPTKLAYPARKTTGVDYSRTAMIIAVLERHAHLQLSTQDIYVNAAGGVVAEGTAMDLPIALAIASSYKNKPIDSETIVVGEIGLAGEIRSVSQIEQRVREAEKLGFKKIIIPKNNLSEVKKAKIELFGVASVKEAL